MTATRKPKQRTLSFNKRTGILHVRDAKGEKGYYLDRLAGLDAREIAREMGLTTTRIDQLRKSARKRLREGRTPARLGWSI